MRKSCAHEKQFKKSKQSKPKKLRRKVKEKFTLEADGDEDAPRASGDHGSRESRQLTNKERADEEDKERRQAGFARAQAKAAEKSRSLSTLCICIHVCKCMCMYIYASCTFLYV